MEHTSKRFIWSAQLTRSSEQVALDEYPGLVDQVGSARVLTTVWERVLAVHGKAASTRKKLGGLACRTMMLPAAIVMFAAGATMGCGSPRDAADGGIDGTDADAAPIVPVSSPTVDYGLALESSEGMDGSIFWQSVFLTKDGRIVSIGTGNHVPDQTNSVRCIDPVREPGTLQYYELFPWTKDADGKNLYASNYDNHPSIYLQASNQILWVGHGVFDVAAERWLYGDRPPFTADQNWDDFLKYPTGWAAAYNPAVAWCDKLNVGVFFGNSSGGYGGPLNQLAIVEPNPDYPATDTQPWRIRRSNVAEIDSTNFIYRARNSAVCVGDQLYVLGPVYGPFDPDPIYYFYQIDVSTGKLVDTLPTPEETMGNQYPQLVYDTHRARMVLLGSRIAVYEPSARRWTDVTPDSYPGYMHPMGVYHPAMDAIFFRGRPNDFAEQPRDASGRRRDFLWNRVTFTD